MTDATRGVGGEEKLRRMQAVTDVKLSALDLDDLLVELLERTKELLATDTATVLLIDPSNRDLVVTASSGIEEEVRQAVRVPFGEGFAGRLAARGRAEILDHIDRTTVFSPALAQSGLAVLAGVPMMAGGRVVGVLHVGSWTPRRFSEDDLDLLRLVAVRASLASEARTARMERANTLALQRSLLPARPPKVTGFEVGARYIPGAEVGVGGDWYDLFTLPTGHVGVVIGDVVGKGLRAAVSMGRIRSVLRAYAAESTAPADVLARVDRVVQLFEPTAMATVLYAVIAPDRSTAVFSMAGHLPPVLVGPDGAADLVQAPADLPIGAYQDPVRNSTTVGLPIGSSLFLYTDGLVERRDLPVWDGINELLAAIGGADGADDMCGRAASGMLRGEAAGDDVAMLALHKVL